jgi:hypothetical protein
VAVLHENFITLEVLPVKKCAKFYLPVSYNDTFYGLHIQGCFWFIKPVILLLVGYELARNYQINLVCIQEAEQCIWVGLEHGRRLLYLGESSIFRNYRVQHSQIIIPFMHYLK